MLLYFPEAIMGESIIRARRSKDRIIFEILKICTNGENITKIVYQTNTNFTTIKSYLDMLIKNDLIECIGTTSPRSYKSTPKGIEMMNRLGSLQKELQELTV